MFIGIKERLRIHELTTELKIFKNWLRIKTKKVWENETVKLRAKISGDNMLGFNQGKSYFSAKAKKKWKIFSKTYKVKKKEKGSPNEWC